MFQLFSPFRSFLRRPAGQAKPPANAEGTAEGRAEDVQAPAAEQHQNVIVSDDSDSEMTEVRLECLLACVSVLHSH